MMSSSPHFGKPLPDSLSVLGWLISRSRRVAFGFWLTTLKYSLVLAGFFFVPAFFGETVVVSVADWVVWAMATAKEPGR